MSLTYIRMIRCLVDILLALWFFHTIRPEAENITIVGKIAGILCLTSTFPIYLFIRFLPSFTFRFLYRTTAYILYLRLTKQLNWHRCVYFALTGWLAFNICSNIFFSPVLQDVILSIQSSDLIGTCLLYLLHIVLLTLVRNNIPFNHITSPGNIRILFALILASAEIFIKQLLNMINAAAYANAPKSTLYLILIQLLLGTSLILFERYQYNNDLREKEQITKIANTYRYETTLYKTSIEEDIRRLHHDMKNHLLAIRQLSGDNERLDNYIHSLVENLGHYTQQVNTGNILLDGLLSEKMRVASQNEINISIFLDFHRCNHMEDMDVCVIFGNLLDNAIEASCKIANLQKRSILIKGHEAAGNLVITFSNFYDGSLKLSNGLPLTSKTDMLHHGIGLSSVRHSLSKYGGTLSISTTENQRILLTILIPYSKPT